MLSTTYYVNRDVDCNIMSRRLRASYTLSTEDAKDQLCAYRKQRDSDLRNAKGVEQLDTRIGSLMMILHIREQWSQDGPFDDCTHWVASEHLA